jgi:quercetin dioxygenase-like cupin family protein
VVNPYTESAEDNVITRTFSVEVDSHELVWHRDRQDRYVSIVEGDGWRLQMDNQLPVTLQPGDSFPIPKNTYHRILKGTTDLVVEIVEG